MDSWIIPTTPKSSKRNSLPTPPDSTPSRASRTKKFINQIQYDSFERKNKNGIDSVKFVIGSAVIISEKAPLRQKWLLIPDYLARSKAYNNKRNNNKNNKNKKNKNKEIDQDVENEDDARYTKRREGDWFHEDGLKGGERIAIITGFFENEEGIMMVQLRWFARPGAVWGEQGPVEEETVEPYELYYTADSSYLESSQSANHSWITPMCTDSIPVSYILTFATIMNPEEFALHPIKKNQESPSRNFMVRKVYDAKPMEGAEFLGEIDWEEVYKKGMECKIWDTEPVMAEEEEVIYVQQKRRYQGDSISATPEKKRKLKQAVECEDDGEAVISDPESSDDDNTIISTTTRITRSNTLITTPTSKSSKSKLPSTKKIITTTPSKTNKKIQPTRTKNAISKAEIRKKKRSNFQERNQAGTCDLPPAFTTTSAFNRLNVFEKSKALLHVSATPKVLPCRENERNKINSILGDAILSQSGTCLFIAGVPGTGKTATVYSVVRDLQQDEDMDEFQFIEINGMKLPEPSAAFSVLWKALSGQKSPARQSLASLENHFQTPDPSRKTTVVLVDELDQMFTKKQDVIYNFFNWPHIAHSRLIVIAIANTINLPETLPGKIRSRLGSNSLAFEAYTAGDLTKIVEARIERFKDKVFAPGALSMLGRKVAAALGDARRALDVARRTVEKVDQRNRENKAEGKESTICSIRDITDTYKEMTEYGASTFVQETSLQQKVFLLALSQCIKRAGLPEVPLGDVFQWHLDFLKRANITSVPSQSELFTIVSGLHSLRLLCTESQREDYYQRVRSVIENGTLFEVLKSDIDLSNHVPKI